jgi:O-antigen biosynthesis protein
MDTSSAVERVEPDNPDHATLLGEHVVRYLFSEPFVAGKRVLDVGCGEGYGAVILHDKGADTVIGLDIDKAVVEKARARYGGENLHFLVGTATDIPCLDHSIDVVVCFEVLEHLIESDQSAFINEIDRILAADGEMVISTPNTEIYSPRVSATILGTNPFHLYEHTYEQFAQALAAPFAQVDIFGQTSIQPELVSASASRSSVRFHAIGDTVYAVDSGDGAVSVAAHLAIPPPPELSPYMIAVCRREAEPIVAPQVVIMTLENSVADVVVFALWARWGAHYQATLDRVMAEYQRLEGLVEERTVWAQTLNHEMERARTVIEDLQRLVEERTAWAQALDRELTEMRNISTTDRGALNTEVDFGE